MTDQVPPSGAKQLLGPATKLVATLIGIGVILAAGAILLEDGPMDSALALFVAGLVLLPFIPVPGRGSRLAVFVLGLALAIGLPVVDSIGVRNQSVAAVSFARDVATALTQAAVKDGLWPADPKAALPDTLPVQSGTLERDLRVDACGGPGTAGPQLRAVDLRRRQDLGLRTRRRTAGGGLRHAELLPGRQPALELQDPVGGFGLLARQTP
jgi:hypothetical protein